MNEIREISPKYIACSAAVAAAGAGLVLYKTLRPKFSIKVNCWFCNTDSVVPYGNRNCWDCPHCDQYNGFKENGDYNKPIPSQFTEEFNHPVTGVQSKGKTANNDNLLCSECNRNQKLKVSQLANFVPRSEANFDLEIEMFRQNLERIYRLCQACDRRARQRIEEQDHKLMREYGLRHSDTSVHNTSVSSTASNTSGISECSDHHILCHLRAPFHIRILRFLTIVCAAVLFIVNLHNLQCDAKSYFIKFPPRTIRYLELVYKSALPLVVFGPLTAIVAVFLHGHNRLVHADILHMTFWLILCCVQSHLLPFKYEDSFLLQTLAAMFTFIMALWCSMCGRENIQMSPVRQNKRRRRTIRDSPASSIRTNSLPTNSPPSSVNGEHKQEAGFFNFFSQAPPADDGPLNRLGTMSLGPPSQRKKKGSSVFNVDTSRVTSTTNPLMSSLSRHAQKRPLIRPARFTAHSMQQQSFQKATTLPQKNAPRPSWKGSNASFQVNESVSNYGDTPSHCDDRHSNSSTSTNSSSSVCPVDTTCPYTESGAVRKSALEGFSAIVKDYMFGISVAVNIVIGLFCILNWNTVQSYFKS